MKLQLMRFVGVYFWPLLIGIFLAVFLYRQFAPVQDVQPNSYATAIVGKSREAIMQLVGEGMAFAQFCSLEINVGALSGYFHAAGISPDAYDPSGRYRAEWETGHSSVLTRRISGVSDADLCAEASWRFAINGSELPNLME